MNSAHVGVVLVQWILKLPRVHTEALLPFTRCCISVNRATVVLCFDYEDTVRTHQHMVNLSCAMSVGQGEVVEQVACGARKGCHERSPDHAFPYMLGWGGMVAAGLLIQEPLASSPTPV